MKKAQVTIFIIIGVILIAAVIFAMFLKPVPDGIEEPIPENFQPINNFIENCVQETSENSIIEIGYKGGISFDMEVPRLGDFYYFYKGQGNLITKETIEDQISKEIKKTFFRCARSFEDFPDFLIEEGSMEVQSRIEDENVLVKVKYPVTITKDEKTILIEDFNANVPVRLGIIYNVLTEINQEQLKNPEAICINCLNEFAEKSDLYIEFYDFDDEIVIFIIRDENSKINNQDFQWRFGHIY